MMEYILLYVWLEHGHMKYMATAGQKQLYTHEQCMQRASASRAQGMKDIVCVKVERDSE
jgi:predicted site-specific integrase-resolvase